MLLLKWQHHWFGDLTNQPVSLHHFLVLFHELFQLSSVLPSYINDCVSGWILKLCNSNVLPYIRTPTSKRKKWLPSCHYFLPCMLISTNQSVSWCPFSQWEARKLLRQWVSPPRRKRLRTMSQSFEVSLCRL